jgi:S1-C subfamily serine protease
MDLDARLLSAVGGLRASSGVLVAARAVNGGAQYGLAPGDVILSINGAPVNNLAGLRSMIGRLPANAACALQIQRQGELLYLSFEIE